MKRFALLLTLCLFAFAANAQTQIEQGSFLIGGSGRLGFNSFGDIEAEGNGVSGTQDYSQTDFGFDVNAGYFFIDNLAAGLNIAVNSSTTETDFGFGNQEISTSTFFVAPFVRYYFPVSDKFAVYPQGKIGFGTATIDNGSSESDTDVFVWGLGAGGALFIGEQVSVDLFLGYDNTTETGESDVDLKQGSFGANIGFNIFF